LLFFERRCEVLSFSYCNLFLFCLYSEERTKTTQCKKKLLEKKTLCGICLVDILRFFSFHLSLDSFLFSTQFFFFASKKTDTPLKEMSANHGNRETLTMFTNKLILEHKLNLFSNNIKILELIHTFLLFFLPHNIHPNDPNAEDIYDIASGHFQSAVLEKFAQRKKRGRNDEEEGCCRHDDVSLFYWLTAVEICRRRIAIISSASYQLENEMQESTSSSLSSDGEIKSELMRMSVWHLMGMSWQFHALFLTLTFAFFLFLVVLLFRGEGR